MIGLLISLLRNVAYLVAEITTLGSCVKYELFVYVKQCIQPCGRISTSAHLSVVLDYALKAGQ